MTIRLATATALVWLGARVAPKSMRPVFRAYSSMLEAFPEQLRQNRKYGIVTAVWGLSSDGIRKAERLQDAAIAASSAERKSIEDTPPHP